MENLDNTGNQISRGQGDKFVRVFGWNILGFLIAFLINNFLNVVYNFPEVSALFDSPSLTSALPMLIYLVSAVLVSRYALKNSERTLRKEADLVHGLNVFLIRWLFFAVLVIGLVDVAIAFIRVEKVLPLIASDTVVSNLNKPIFVGKFIHIPIFFGCFFLALLSTTLGFTWLALLIVLAELLIVITRFVFSYEQPFMADLVRYWYAALFLFASAYTLFDEGHVRVDIVYAGLTQKTMGLLNAINSIILGVSTSLLIVMIAFNGKYSIINKPLMNFEVSQTGTVGMFIKYQMALFLGIFGITMVIQFVSYFFGSVADYRGYPGKKAAADNLH